MHFDRDRVRAVARLARLRLTADEEDALAHQLTGILDHIDRLRAVAVRGVEPMVHATELANVLGDDAPVEPLGAEPALSGAPDQEGGRFRVPPVIEAS